MSPGVFLCCGGTSVLVVSVILGAIFGVLGGGRSVVLNLGEERLIALNPVSAGADSGSRQPRHFAITDDCRGCAVVKAWTQNPDLVPEQWSQLDRWTRSMTLHTTLKPDRYEYWYFNVRNGSTVDVTADFDGSHGHLLTMVIDDSSEGSNIWGAVESRWKSRNAWSYTPRVQSDRIVVDGHHTRSTVIVLVAHDGYMKAHPTVRVDVGYVWPRRGATPAAKSVEDTWARPVRVVGRTSLPAEAAYITVEAPRVLSSTTVDTVTVTLYKEEPEESDGFSDFWATEIRHTIIAVATIGLGWVLWQYLQRRESYPVKRANWEEEYGAAYAASKMPQPLGGVPANPPPPRQQPEQQPAHGYNGAQYDQPNQPPVEPLGGNPYEQAPVGAL